MDISQRHYEVWNTFTDKKLQKHFLYITRWAREDGLKLTMDKLMDDRGLKIFDDEVVNAEFEKAMQTLYFKDEELLERVHDSLYGNN